jgi:hypothetical protein
LALAGVINYNLCVIDAQNCGIASDRNMLTMQATLLCHATATSIKLTLWPMLLRAAVVCASKIGKRFSEKISKVKTYQTIQL